MAYMKNMNDNIDINLFDERIIITNCTIEIWRNSVTGKESVGWYKTEASEELKD